MGTHMSDRPLKEVLHYSLQSVCEVGTSFLQMRLTRFLQREKFCSPGRLCNDVEKRAQEFWNHLMMFLNYGTLQATFKVTYRHAEMKLRIAMSVCDEQRKLTANSMFRVDVPSTSMQKRFGESDE